MAEAQIVYCTVKVTLSLKFSAGHFFQLNQSTLLAIKHNNIWLVASIEALPVTNNASVY